LRFLVRFADRGLSRSTYLASLRTMARSLGADARNPKWTSAGSLELDIFCPSRADFELFLSAAAPMAKLEFSRDLNEAPSHRTDDEIFAEARGLFNAERYWECHEVLEGLWRQKQGEEKRVLQGMILVCAAFVHHQKDDDDVVALGILERASVLLEYRQGVYGGIDIPRLKSETGRIRESGKFTRMSV
jgi:uncharacterized protein